MFGMMVLLIALLKITNSCSVWVPSEAAIFNRNEWYNTVADGPEISVGNDLPKEFRLICTMSIMRTQCGGKRFQRYFLSQLN